jgi:hypothetical protein
VDIIGKKRDDNLEVHNGHILKFNTRRTKKKSRSRHHRHQWIGNFSKYSFFKLSYYIIDVEYWVFQMPKQRALAWIIISKLLIKLFQSLHVLKLPSSLNIVLNNYEQVACYNIISCIACIAPAEIEELGKWSTGPCFLLESNSNSINYWKIYFKVFDFYMRFWQD